MPSSARLYGVLSSHIDGLWDEVTPMLSEAIHYADGKYSLDSVRKSLEQKDMQLWVVMNGEILAAGVTQVVSYPDKKVCLIMFVGGRKMDEWINVISGIENWARDEGCASVEIYGRKGWAKVLKDYDTMHVVLRKKLDENLH